MKKLMAIILSLICVLSCFTVGASATSTPSATGIVGDLANKFFEGIFDIEMEEDTPIGYGVIYDIDTFEGVSVIYKPSPSISFKNPGTYTITSDTPLSIDYEFVCWKDASGKNHYAGEKIYVDGMITLYAVWEEKKDTDVRVARIIKTTFEALKRMINKFFGIFDTIKNFEPAPSAKPGVYDLTLNKIFYEPTEGEERIILYIDSEGIYDDGRLTRIDSANTTPAEIYLCSGWDVVTGKALNVKEYTAPYYFSPQQGAYKSDIVIISTVLDGSDDIVSDYLADNEDVEKFYMVVTVNDSLYSSSGDTNGLGYDEKCNPVSVVFTLTK